MLSSFAFIFQNPYGPTIFTSRIKSSYTGTAFLVMFPPIVLTPSPMRVLVQTLTHLVPSDNLIANGEPYGDKLFSMLDRTCNHVWDYPFEPGLQRWYSYGDEFGYNNRVCFFLLDYGDAPDGKDEEVPIQCLTWDGEKLYVPCHSSQKGTSEVN